MASLEELLAVGNILPSDLPSDIFLICSPPSIERLNASWGANLTSRCISAILAPTGIGYISKYKFSNKELIL